ncbi:efflux transporter outer membrane subunit [Halopseudomonas pelagia]|uniref:Efflux transporter outer membrane subunit n=1 Tax=Halopseudomonas pelagia TaxID=553151 RepID=A0AA91U5E7_9GAMM|nr:efflux transporter outer membrane subunit [Halopseudomonas pelagia]PCD00691.1 RND transporter [Halopseudomonas pelagia]QFY58635.1 efflux transporter outer membrane subunit [Halopseudomonas pelagia]
MRRRFYLPALLTLALSACSSVPEHAEPEIPDTWLHTADSQAVDAETLANWWQQFEDPALTRLVSKAMQQSYDTRLAMLRVNSARAQLRQSRAGLFPALDLPGSASRQWIENDQDVEPDSPLAEFGLDDDIRFDSWELALQASWELDLFGATRARTQSAGQMVRSAQAEAIAARLAVASNTAQGYIQLRALQNQFALLEEGIEIASELERVAGLLFEAGEVTRLDVEAAAAEKASLQADLAELEINLDEALLGLDTLLAEPPGTTAGEIPAQARVPLAERPIPAGQPLDLLRRRPDLIAAAAQLEGSRLQSLAARRDLFPTLAVQAAVGRSGMSINGDYGSASNFSRIGATFGLPILDFGRRGSAIDLADLEGESSYIGFQQALAEALIDVERGLATSAGQQRRHAALQRSLAHYQRTFDLASTSYRLGEANLDEVLDAQRGLLQARQSYLQGRTALATAQVALFVALGGGWQAEVAGEEQGSKSAAVDSEMESIQR